MPEYISITEIANELGLDKSGVRRYAIKNGFSFVKMRTLDSKNQLTLALTKEDSEMLYELRRNQGFGANKLPVKNGHGFFYIVQLLPSLEPTRVKLGWASDPEQRLSAYRTISPEAKIIKTWSCHSSWEKVAIVSVSRIGCEQIGIEIFSCDDIRALVKRCDDFFAIMPKS